MIKAIIFDFNGVIYLDDYNQPLLELIKNLRPKYKIGLISNYSDDGYRRYVEPVKDYFDDLVISSHVGLHKPDPAIYQLAAERLGVKPAGCVFIDDHDFRIDGAAKAGMRAILYEDFGQFKTELNKLLASPDA